MHHVKLIACTVLIAGVAALAQASGSNYGGGHHSKSLANYGGGLATHQYGSAAGRHNNGKSQLGPYHSYAVRPAVYGGHRLYQYQGYSRHYPAPSMRHMRKSRKNQHRARRSRPYGNSNAGQAYGEAAHNQYQSKPEHLPAGYTLKPIKALALVPISHGSQYFNGLVQYPGKQYGNELANSNYRQQNHISGQYASHSNKNQYPVGGY